MSAFFRKLTAYEWQAVSDAALWSGIAAIAVIGYGRMVGGWFS